MQRILLGTLITLISGFCQTWAGPMSAKDIVKKVKEKYDNLRSLQADFEQVFVWDLAGETQTVAGKIYLNQGNRYRIETESQAIVTDGLTVWTYSKERAQVIVDQTEKSADNLPRNLLFRYSEDYRPILRGEETLEGRKTYVVYLEPKNDEGLVKSMTIWVDASTWLTRKMEQVDINENRNTYIVRNVEENVQLDPALFTFVPTDDMEVVDLRSSN